MNEYLILITAFISLGIMEIILGLPLFLEKVKPNWLYGFRLPSTLSKEEIWYKSNKYVGRDFVVTGILVVFVSLLLIFLKSSFSVFEIILISIFLLTLPIIIIIIRGVIFLKKLKN